MKTIPVGELKARFSDVIKAVKGGEEIVISYGRKKESIAVIVPFTRYRRHGIRLGVLQGKATCRFAADYKMTVEELAGP